MLIATMLLLNRVLSVYYLAYGSNMSTEVLSRRVLSKDLLQAFPASLNNYRLAFNLPSSPILPAFASIVPSPGSVVHGAVYELTAAQLLLLLASEGTSLLILIFDLLVIIPLVSRRSICI